MLKLNVSKINAEMVRLGWDKARLQKELGLCRTSVYYYLQKSTSLKRVSRLAKALNLDEKDLLT